MPCDFIPEFDCPDVPHLPCVLLLDTSGSMTGESINNLNKALSNFIEQVQADEMSARCVDVAIIEFNSDVRVVQDFTPVSKMEPITLIAGGVTSTGNAINLAIDKLRERRRLYGETGTLYYQPWIVMITDGEPTDDTTIAVQRIIEEESKRKLIFWTVGVSGCNFEQIAKLSKNKHIMTLDSYNFTDFFNWLGDRFSSIIGCTNTNPVSIDNLPDGVVVVIPYETLID